MNLIPDETRAQDNKTASLTQTQQNISKDGIFFPLQCCYFTKYYKLTSSCKQITLSAGVLNPYTKSPQGPHFQTLQWGQDFLWKLWVT